MVHLPGDGERSCVSLGLLRALMHYEDVLPVLAGCRGGGHVAAMKRGPDTELPIREAARELLRSMRGDPRER